MSGFSEVHFLSCVRSGDDRSANEFCCWLLRESEVLTLWRLVRYMSKLSDSCEVW